MYDAPALRVVPPGAELTPLAEGERAFHTLKMLGEHVDFRDLSLQSITDFSEQLDRVVQGLTPEQWRWRPAPDANHILWTVWHLTRIEDGWLNRYLSSRGELWKTNGWAEAFGLSSEDNYGFGDTPEQVGSMPDVAPEVVAGYRADVLSSANTVIRSLSHDDLENTYPDRVLFQGRPAPTVLWVLARIPVECSQHIGQAAYIRGLMDGQTGWRN